MAVCTRVRQSSAYVKDWLTCQPGVKEPSLTDWLLFDISSRVPNVLYYAFTQHEEARTTGADWEWWFVFRRQSMRLRVQAKKIHPTANNYSSLARTNRHGLQIDMLLKDARQVNAIPLYALYSAVSTNVMCGLRSQKHRDGVFIAGGQQLYNTFIAGPRKFIGVSDLLALSNPFSCFVCCPLVRASEDDMQRYFEKYYATEFYPTSSNTENPVGFHRELPSYVSSFLEYGQEQLPDWWEREFRFQLRGFKALVVYDFR